MGDIPGASITNAINQAAIRTPWNTSPWGSPWSSEDESDWEAAEKKLRAEREAAELAKEAEPRKSSKIWQATFANFQFDKQKREREAGEQGGEAAEKARLERLESVVAEAKIDLAEVKADIARLSEDVVGLNATVAETARVLECGFARIERIDTAPQVGRPPTVRQRVKEEVRAKISAGQTTLREIRQTKMGSLEVEFRAERRTIKLALQEYEDEERVL
jgi:hypothetical protein